MATTALIPVKSGEQNFQVTGSSAGELKSYSWFTCTLRTEFDKMEFPVQTCTVISEVRDMLCVKLGYIDGVTFDFVVKQGCSYKKLKESDQVARNMIVRGLKNFKVAAAKYEHPFGVIGGGYQGIKTALWLTTQGYDDYVVFDRYDRVGGHTWLEMANKTTKLQTEFPTYHIWFGEEWSKEGIKKCGGPPVDWPLWPTRDELLKHFQLCCDDYGLMPHFRLGTNVASMEIVGAARDNSISTSANRYYQLTCDPVKFTRKDSQGGGALAHQLGGDPSKHQHEGIKDNTRASFKANFSCLCMWPGALTFPRPVVYPGEDEFGGMIDYAVEMRCDYKQLPGKVVTIVGHGAFTMENIRTCLEERVKHIYVVCRKPNLTCPRVVSWFVNQSTPPITAGHLVDMLCPPYEHVRIDGVHMSPWDFHTVHANASRTNCTLLAKTRFGIGDVYFLSQAYGLTDVVVGTVKRCTHHTLHLDTGRKLECEAVLKCTGCLGDWKVDKLMHIKEMRGWYVNGDVRRVVSAQADGLEASNFSGTTGGPGYYGMCKQLLHFWEVPKDWERLQDSGVIDQLPVHRAGEPDEEFPAYYFTAKHAVGFGILVSASCPLLTEKSANDDAYKHYIALHCCPAERIIRDAKEDWERYERIFRESGMVPKDAPYVPYLYTEEDIQEMYRVHESNMVAKYEKVMNYKR